MDHDRITISSATGVDVTLSIAGPGARSYAFLIDWHFRALLALAWLIVASLATTGRVLPTRASGPPSLRWILIALLPTLVIYFLYHPVLEVVMSGRTPGKRMAGVRIVDEYGGRPSVGALLIRNVFRLIDALPAMYALGLLMTIFTSRRVRIGDVAAGTLLVHDHDDSVGRLEVLGGLSVQSRHDPAVVEVALDLIKRWDELSDERRAAVGLAVLGRLEPSVPTADLAVLGATALRMRILAALGLEAPP